MNQHEFDKLFNIRTDGQIHQGALNLDGMTEDELEVVVGHPAIHQEVQIYALGLRSARRHRLHGSIHTALSLEAGLEKCYRRIPANLRW